MVPRLGGSGVIESLNNFEKILLDVILLYITEGGAKIFSNLPSLPVEDFS